MKKFIILLFSFFISVSIAFAEGKGIVAISDGSTTVYPYQIDVTGGTVADGGDGTADLTISGGSYTASGTLLNLTGTAFSVKEGTLTTTKGCKYVTGTGLVCDQDYITGISGSDVTTALGYTPTNVNLDTNADTLLSLSTQTLGLDTQAANTVLAGRVSAGTALVPTFRSLVALDIPDLSATYQTALTFGIADTNKVQINAADVADNDYAKFTATGLEGRSYSEVLSDIGAQGVLTNSAGLLAALNDETGTGLAVFATSPNFTTSISFNADPADTGAIRLSNADYIYSEASPAGTDISVLGVDATEIIQIGASGASGVTVTPATTITGAVTLTGGIASIGAASNLSAQTVTLGVVAGAIDAGGATSLEIPNAANPTLATTGMIAINTTDKTLELNNGANQIAFPTIHIAQGTFDLAGWYDTGPAGHEVWLIDLHTDSYPHGIYITKVYVDCDKADPTTELNANLNYCDATNAAFPGANPTLIKAIDTTTGNFADAAVNTAVPTGKSIYITMDADPTDANTVYHIRIHYYIPVS